MTNATLPISSIHDRPDAKDGRSFEFLFESLLRPGNWAATLAYSFGLQGRLRTSVTTIQTAQPKAGRPPLRIAFASDFHAGGMTDQRLLVQACELLADMEPDLLLLGGDYVTVRGADIHRLAPLLAEIPAPLGKFAVLGNHDLHANYSIIVSELERAGVCVLSNERAELPAPFADVSICGLDDPTHGEPRGDLAIDGATGMRIVLMHSPDGLEAVADRAYDLALCGHTHGGQIRLPGGPAMIVPGGRLNRRYCGGNYEMPCENGSRVLIVSHGVGCSGVPVRAFTPPEVHLCLVS
ncbi:MAG TPA: metallophosphoesterase [Gemmatimonadaceae bacterium]